MTSTRHDRGATLSLRCRPGHTDCHFIQHQRHLAKNSNLMKLRQIFQVPLKTSGHKLVILLEQLYLKMEVIVSEPCDVIRS